jgi:hypothetical protein
MCQATADVPARGGKKMVLPPVKMFDARVPPASAPAGYRAVAGYIGGDTPHVWTDDEWKRFGSLPKLPIWVADLRREWAVHVSAPAGQGHSVRQPAAL